MSPYWELDGNKIYLGHAIDTLESIKEQSAHCCVTSPPYYGLRNYNLPPQVWKTDGPMCAESDHQWHENWSGKVTSYKNKSLSKNIGSSDGTRERKRHHLGDTCVKCGAWRGALGVEPTPALYVWHIVCIFRAVKRVLRDDGTLWLNMGDSYSGSGSSQIQKGKDIKHANVGNAIKKVQRRVGIIDGLPPKNLIGIPWMVAFALQADGWILRSEIIWEKPNCMPGSEGDRPTKSHEQLFLFSKKQRYFYDRHAILEPYTGPLNRWGGEVLKHETEKHAKYFKMQGIGKSSILRAGRSMRPNSNGRNKRTVWRIPSRPFAGDHFAVFPPGLPEPCILAGSSEKGCCVECGAPWKRGKVDKHTDNCNTDMYENKAMQGMSEAKTDRSISTPDSKDVQSMCKQKTDIGLVGKQGTKSIESETIQKGQQKKDSRKEKKLPANRSRPKEYEDGLPTILSQPNANTKGQGENQGEGSEIFKDGKGADKQQDSMQPKKSAFGRSEGELFGGRLGKYAEGAEKQMLLLPSPIHTSETSNDRPCNSTDKGRRSQQDEYSSGLPSVQHQEMEPNWCPTCQCNEDIKPCTILDPFFGTGTTGETALKHNRKFTGIDLSQIYLDENAIPRIKAEMSQRKLSFELKDEPN